MCGPSLLQVAIVAKEPSTPGLAWNTTFRLPALPFVLQVAIAAKEHSVPMYVAAESYKFARWVALAASGGGKHASCFTASLCFLFHRMCASIPLSVRSKCAPCPLLAVRP